MLSASYRQTVETEVPNHFRYRFKGSTELPEDVFTGVVLLLDSHMHEAFGAPE